MIGSTTACGTGITPASTGSSGVNKQSLKVDTIAAIVPKSIREKGTLTVAAAVYPPAVIKPANGGRPTGWDIENVRQIAAVLGLKVDFKIVPLDGIIADLRAGRYDAVAGEIYATPERTKVVTFVVNHLSSDVLMVLDGSEIASVQTETDLCGRSLAAQLGSAEAQLAEGIKRKCAGAGLEPVTVKTFKQQSEVDGALRGKRVDAAVSSTSAVVNVMTKSYAQVDLVELPFAPKYQTGLVLGRNKDTAQLATAVEAATAYLIENGELKKILDKFNRGQGYVRKTETVPSPAG